ncbi:uncharacterized protein LOC142588845 [Dermacentor variabilis]|uniref:uncharacterized protein LOC142588845 n=1 Tax=Dermacentor variabilis TaxID=34621 RepID=UPI003F5BB7F9
MASQPMHDDDSTHAATSERPKARRKKSQGRPRAGKRRAGSFLETLELAQLAARLRQQWSRRRSTARTFAMTEAAPSTTGEPSAAPSCGSTEATEAKPAGGSHGGGDTGHTTNNRTSLGDPAPHPPPATAGYHGVSLGDFQEAFHNVMGHVYVADENTIHIMQFSYDGQGPDAFFAVSKEDKLGGTPTKLKNEKDENTKLAKYDNEDIMIKLDDKITDYKSFGVYCFQASASFGYVTITDAATVKEMELTVEEASATEEIKVTLMNQNTMKVSLKYTGADADDIFVYGGKEMPPTVDAGTKLSDEKLSGEANGASTDTMISLHDKDWTSYKWVAFFDTTGTAKGNVKIPDKLTVPYVKAPTSRRHGVKGRHAAGTLAVKAAPRKARLLVCSYGESGVVKTMVPSDGLCDVVFYTDVTYDGDAEAIVPKDGGPAFDVLKSAAKKYTRTSFGTSMATGAIADATKEKKSELMAAMADLFSAKMLHFGMLNVENIEDYDNLKDADLQYIKVADEFLKRKTSARSYHKALGLSLRDGSKGAKILDAAKRVSDDFPELTMVIIKLHTENFGPAGDHWPLAPNPDDVDLSEHNALSLAAIKDDMEEQLEAISSQGKYALLSFAMFARTYRMKKTWNGAAAREMSESSLNMDYSSVCKMKTQKDSEDTGTLYATDEHKKFLALFDSASTFTKKANKRLSMMPQNFTGLAVYNVEMDDYKGACGKGKFVRLKAIKSALAA